MKVNVCVICLKTLQDDNSSGTSAAAGEDSCDPPLLNNFLKFAQNYLRVSLTATHQLLLNRRGDGHEGEAFCEKCELTFIIPICHFYTQLLSTQLRLSWELEQLGELLHKSQRSVPNDQDSHTFSHLQEFRSLLTQKCQLKRKETLPSILVERLNIQLTATEPYAAPAANQLGDSNALDMMEVDKEQESEGANEDVKIEIDFSHDDDDGDRDDDNNDVDPLSFDPADSFHFKSEPGFLDTTLDDDKAHLKNEDFDNTPTFPPNFFTEPLFNCSSYKLSLYEELQTHQNPTPGVSYAQPKSCELSISPDSLEMQGHLNHQEQEPSTSTSRPIGRTTHIRKTNPGYLPQAPTCNSATTSSNQEPVVPLVEGSEPNPGTNVNPTFEHSLMCSNCPATFSQPNLFTDHIRLHRVSAKKRICKVKRCGWFVASNEISIHWKQHHPESEEKCDKCGAIFFNQQRMYEHQKAHESGNQGHICDQCDWLVVKIASHNAVWHSQDQQKDSEKKNHKVVSSPVADDGKPPFKYSQLIAQAIASSPDHQLTVKGIYSYITEHYSYYKTENKGWQNAISRRLSLSRCFLKVPRPQEEPGLGSFWRICTQFESTLIKQPFWERKPGSHAFFVPSSKSAAASLTHTGAIATIEEDQAIFENFHPEVEAAAHDPSSFAPPPIPPTKKRMLLPPPLPQKELGEEPEDENLF